MSRAGDKMTGNQTLADDNSRRSAFVADGYDRLVDGVESEARRIVEAKYSAQWNSSGIFARWRLQRKMKAEIADLADKMMPDVSSEAQF